MNTMRNIGLTIVFTAILLAAAPDLPAMGLFKGEDKMGSNQEIVNGILNIPEEDFFKDESNRFLDMELKLADTEFKGVAIKAPARISMDKQSQVPVVMATQQTGLRAWEFPRNKNCVLAATHMATRTTFFGQVFKNPKADTFSMPVKAPQPPKPEGANAIALSTGVRRIDAQKVLPLPMQAGTLRLSVIMYDWVSNTIEVERVGAANAPPAAMPAIAPQPAASGQGLERPSFLPRPNMPAPSGGNEPSADMTLTPNPKTGVKLAVDGFISVVADTIHIPTGPISLTEIDGTPQKAYAVVPATLAIFGKNWAVPLRFDYGIPVYSQKEIKPGEQVTAYFSLDALADSPMTLPPGDYAAYLMVEGVLHGPYPFKST